MIWQTITLMMISAIIWKPKNRLPRLSRNIHHMLTQLLKNQNNNNTTGNEEENLNNESPKSEQSKEGSSVDADVIKGIQA